MSNRLDGKSALVTGAGSGIGLAVAQRFVAEGALVYFADINAESAEKAARATGSRLARTVQMDIADEPSVIDAYSLIAEDGPLDVVVANAGVQFSAKTRKWVTWTWKSGKRR